MVVRAHRDAAGAMVLILEDVTEVRRLRQIRSEFVDNLSHELRTPLSTVSLLAETLARDAAAADVPAKMRDRIALIEVETGHLVQMVSELLDLARIEGGSPMRLGDDVDLGALAVTRRWTACACSPSARGRTSWWRSRQTCRGSAVTRHASARCS